MQEDDLAGQAPDSRLTHPAPVALVAEWTGDPGYNQNRFQFVFYQRRQNKHALLYFFSMLLKICIITAFTAEALET
jgi:hypothetical protein